jgi:hypothetical protein
VVLLIHTGIRIYFKYPDHFAYNLGLLLWMIVILVVLISTKETNRHYIKNNLLSIVLTCLAFVIRLYNFTGKKDVIVKDKSTYIGTGWLLLTNIVTLWTALNLYVIHNNFK